MAKPDLVIAIVLGSNSFHMLTANREGNQLTVVDHRTEAVQLAAGIDASGKLDQAHRNRAATCLSRFANLLTETGGKCSVAAVATGVLRRPGDPGDFVRSAANALGIPVYVLSAHEEASLSYLGLGLTFGFIDEPRLVVDLGGGTTEFVHGRGRSVSLVESMELGCVTVHRRFFAGEADLSTAFSAAEAGTADALQPIAASLNQHRWTQVVGVGGTIAGAGTIIQLRRLGGSAITRKGLDRFKRAVIDSGLEPLASGIVTSERIVLLPAGLAILAAILDVLQIDRMEPASGALREGVLVTAARGMRPGATAVYPH